MTTAIKTESKRQRLSRDLQNARACADKDELRESLDVFPDGLVSSSHKSSRGRAFMIVCNLDKFYAYSNNDKLSIAKYIRNTFKDSNLEWCYGLHYDTRHRHVVVALYFKNPRTTLSIARAFHISIELVLKFKGSKNTMFSYAGHYTFNARLIKQVIPYDQIVASFDYPTFIKRIEEHVEKNTTAVQRDIKLYAECKISLARLINKIGPIGYMKNLITIGTARSTRYVVLHNQYSQEMQNKPIEIYVFDNSVLANRDMGDNDYWMINPKDSIAFNQMAEREGNLDPLFDDRRIKKKIAAAFLKSQKQSSYYILSSKLSYFDRYLGETSLIADYDDLLDAAKNKANIEAMQILQNIYDLPSDSAVHDSRVRVGSNFQYLNCKTLCVYSQTLNPFDTNPFHHPSNVHYIGTNSEYKSFIKKYALDSIDPDLKVD